MSMAFRVRDKNSGWSDDYTTRAFRDLDLHKGDVSAVNAGANEHTEGSVSMRSLERFLATLTPEQAAVARRRLAVSEQMPADLVQYLARAAELRRGPASGKRKARTSGPIDAQTWRARQWVLQHVHGER